MTSPRPVGPAQSARFACTQLQSTTRRHFLGAGSLGLGGLAYALLAGPGAASTPDHPADPLAPKAPPRPPRAKRVIYIHLSGSPPHLDLFSDKPELRRLDGQPVPESFLRGKRFAFTSGVPKLLGSPRKFAPRGKSGMVLSDAIPRLHEVADEFTLIRSMRTDEFNHAPAELLLFTGSNRQGRPGLGAWVTYGLGSENQNLPGFVVLISSGVQPSGGANCWGSGFLPTVYQGVQCRSQGDPVLYVSNPAGISPQLRGDTIQAINDLNRLQEQELRHPETTTRIAQYELAFRMQTAVPEVMDIRKETTTTLSDYGATPGTPSFAANCLLARRLSEQGVRFVQLFDWGWDFHGTNPAEDIRDGLTKKCATIDQPIAALIRDLKRRGLLEDTLVVVSGEFGRTPFREGRTAGSTILGRDHYPEGFCVLLAGGGVRRGMTLGATDELGFSVAERPVHVHDLQATLLDLLGFDHTQLTYRYQGRDFRLTDVHGHVVTEILA